jgi:serine/threonine protein kinase/Tol biopolymer transport system component
MPLSPGSRLGPYEILAPIGAGGMGEVYRAKDPRLGREVAIKVLPASFSADPDRLRRFEQEARAAGVLNHPNITAVHDIGTNTSDGAPYVVQELLEGETLRAVLSGGRLPQRKTIDYGLQIVHGLAAAHEKGIIHRDLKPENVFVTNDGRVKILDFGLAKLTHTEEKGQATNLPTATAGTEPGMVLGTLGYMAPEQVRGKSADARSDIFSFGAILYEMLSGKRAVHGDSAADTMSAILKEDPPDLSVTNENISPGLDRIVRHCLEKNPEQRFHSAHDVAFDLEALSGLSTPRLEPSKARSQSRLPSRLAAAAVVAALAIGLAAGRLIWKTPPDSHPTFHRLTFRRGPVRSARFAPDGNTVVYSAQWDGAAKAQLYSTRVESPESLRLPLAEGRVEAISRTGEMLVLSSLRVGQGFAAAGTLSQAPLSGSASRAILEDVADADWSADGASQVVVRAPQWRYRLEYPVGKVLYETTGYISHPRLSHRGDAIAFLDHPILGDDRGSVAVMDLAGKKKTLSDGWESMQGLAWSASGREIWFTATRAGSARALYAVTPAGRERAVLTTPAGIVLQDISRDGRVLVEQNNARVGFLALLPGETKERDLSNLEWSNFPRLFEDGKSVAFSEQGEAGGPGYSVYLRKLDGSAAVRLGEGNAVAVSPDGKWVLTCQIQTTPATLVLLPTGAGQPKTFPKDSIDRSASISFGVFFPDGKRIAFNGQESGKPPRVFVQDLAGGAARPVTAEGVTGKLLSPDGKYLLTQSPSQEFALVPFPLEGAGGGSAAPAQPIRGLEPNDQPLRWAADGRALFLASSNDTFPARVYRLDLTSGRRDVWKEFMPGDPTGITAIGPNGISADGKTITFGYSHTLSDLYIAEGLR